MVLVKIVVRGFPVDTMACGVPLIMMGCPE